MALIDQLAFEGKHHLVKVCFGGEMEANLNSKVSGAFPFRDPFEAYLFALGPGSSLLAGPDGS
jgi:hypothetical protein